MLKSCSEEDKKRFGHKGALIMGIPRAVSIRLFYIVFGFVSPCTPLHWKFFSPLTLVAIGSL